jgi:hypothetical protein
MDIDAALKKLNDALIHFKKTTKGHMQMAQPLPPASQWAQGMEDFNEGLSLLQETPQLPIQTLLPRYGIANGYKLTVRSPADRAYELDRCKEAGAKWIRIDTYKDNQPGVEAVLDDADARDMKVCLILHGTTGPFPPTTAYDFAKAQAAKWKGRNVVYEFCNEPDLNGWNGTQYGTALVGCRKGLISSDPDAKLLAGAIFKCETPEHPGGNMAKFINDMYDAGAKGHFDAISVHLYDVPTWNDPRNGFYMTFGPGPNVRQVMDDHGDQALPIICTEAGSRIKTGVDEAKQAERIAAQLADTRCESMATFTMLDDTLTGFGLLRSDRTKRPSWNEYVKATSEAD